MMCVKTKIGPSTIHGTGLFADEFIPKGTIVWRFTPVFDQKFTREQILSFPDLVQIYLYEYSWKSKKSHLYCSASDNGKYFNHSEKPNTISKHRDNEEEVITVAARDISAGEELTSNYNDFETDPDDDNVLDEICTKFNLVENLDPRFKPI